MVHTALRPHLGLELDPKLGARILIVEDERVVAMSLQDKLEAMGHYVTALADTGERAIALATEQRPHLVLMDIRLRGEMDGVAAAAAIRERLTIPIVFLTAYSTRDIIERAKLTEPCGYVLKPIADRELQVVIEMALYRHKAQQELLTQKRLLAATLQSIGDGVIATDADGRITFINPVAERMLNCELDGCRNRAVEAVMSVVDELTRTAVEIPVRRAVREKSIQAIRDHVLLLRDGDEISIDWSAAPILGETGDIMGGVLVLRDATERHAHMRQISTLAAVVASSQDAVIGFTADGTITSWNPAAERLTGYSPAEVIGQPTTILATPEGLEQMRSAIRRVTSGERIAPYETVRRRKDGSTFTASVSLSIVTDERARTVGFSASIRDITHLRQLEEQFRQAQKMESVGLLAGGVAHDFNNLLTVIGGYSRILLKEPLGDGQHQMVQEIWEAGERAANLTRQLLAFSRKQHLSPEVVDLNQVVARSGRMLRRLIGEDIEISFALDPAVDAALVDPAQVEQALVNLAVNARDAMPTGGRLIISTGNTDVVREHDIVPPGRYVRLTVFDTGCGMTDEVRARVFEPFFTTKGPGKGTGLGLSMVYGFVRQSGGCITATSAVGVGTTFEILLPRADRPEEVEREEAALCPPARAGDTILLAEDDDGVRKYVAHILRTQGYAVLEATDGSDAVRVAEEHVGPIHLLLTDVVMPVMGGRPLADALRGRLPNLKVLYASGYHDDALLRHGVCNRADNFLQKPFTTIELCRAVHKLITETF